MSPFTCPRAPAGTPHTAFGNSSQLGTVPEELGAEPRVPAGHQGGGRRGRAAQKKGGPCPAPAPGRSPGSLQETWPRPDGGLGGQGWPGEPQHLDQGCTGVSSLQTFRETVGLGLGRTETGQAEPTSAGEAGSVRVSQRGFGGRLLGRKQTLSASERLAHPQQACSRFPGLLGRKWQ